MSRVYFGVPDIPGTRPQLGRSRGLWGPCLDKKRMKSYGLFCRIRGRCGAPCKNGPSLTGSHGRALTSITIQRVQTFRFLILFESWILGFGTSVEGNLTPRGAEIAPSILQNRSSRAGVRAWALHDALALRLRRKLFMCRSKSKTGLWTERVVLDM